MSKWITQPIALTANMVAGTDPLLAAEATAATNKVLVAIQSRSAGAVEFTFGPAVATAGQGVSIAAGVRWDLPSGGMPFNGAIYVRGGTAAEYIVLIFA